MKRLIRSKRTARGFTLLELLLFIGLAAILMMACVGLLFIALQARLKNQAVAEVEQQGQQVLQMLMRTALDADGIVSPATGTSATSLSLKMPSPVASPVVFDSATGVMRMTEAGGAAVALSSSRVVVSDLLFRNLSTSGGSGTVRIEFSLSHLNPGARNEYEYVQTFQGTANLR